jgi:outer membrane lipase/esterase
MMLKLLKRASAVALLVLVAACGGGGGVSGGGSASSVKVFGDSLADSGTFGIRFTVNQAGPNGTATPIWVDKVAATFGRTVCNFYNATSFTTFIAPTTACTNFSVGGGRINSLAATGGPTSPFSIPNQMDTAATVAGGTFTSAEMMLVVGGGNDAADLVGAYLGANTAPGLGTYTSVLSSLLPSGSVTAMIGTAGGPENLAGMYMNALANKFADDITNKLINRGAQRVVLLNMPAVTNTPRFKAVLQGVALQASPAVATQVEGLVKAWTVAFNTQLNNRLGSNSKVAIVDFYSEFNNQVATPAQFDLINVATPACPVIRISPTDGLPEYNFATCTAAALDASGPVGWRNYAFSDGFHPTPFGHQLLAQLVSRSIVSKGWL